MMAPTNPLSFYRSIDFGASAGLMFLANSILFYAPPDIQTLVLFFLVQALTQLAGFCSEVFLANNLVNEAKNAFWVAGILYVVPWALRFAMFFLTIKEDALGEGTQSNSAPIQVWFFLGWIFQTFFLFPLALYYKIQDNSSNNDEKTLRYEIVYSLLSFLAKLPLLAVFIGGSFQRGLFTTLGNETDSSTPPPPPPPASFDGETYLALFLPMGLSLLGSGVIVYFFWTELGLEDYGSKIRNFFQVGKVAGICSLYLLLSTAVLFIPVFIGLAPNVNATAVTYMSLTIPPFVATVAWQLDLRFNNQ